MNFRNCASYESFALCFKLRSAYIWSLSCGRHPSNYFLLRIENRINDQDSLFHFFIRKTIAIRFLVLVVLNQHRKCKKLLLNTKLTLITITGATGNQREIDWSNTGIRRENNCSPPYY